MNHPPLSSIGHSPRRGMALILVLGALTIIIGLVVIASERTTSTAQTVTRFDTGSDAAAAVEAVLIRRERDVNLLASIGDSTNFANWSTGIIGDGLGKNNYGVDQIGGLNVRWKIEPTRTAPYNDPAASVDIDYVVNPCPDATFSPPAGSRQLPNDTLYLYRVSAEALSQPTANDPDGKRLAQGIRYVSINREPLFRYVIFYAQRGAKGDLEMSHADPVNIQGSIYSNGSVYLGGGLKVNDMLAQRGSLDGSFNPTSTSIGPDADANKVRVVGLDGIFRLSKPLMYSIVNGFPLTNTTVAAAGTPVGDWTAAGSYDTTASVFTLEKTVPSGFTPYDMTANGTQINPYRITDASGAVTQGPTGTDNSRLINTVPLRGVGVNANDSRDHARSATRKWPLLAASDFNNYPRTSENGATFKSVQGEMFRGLEAQRLTYVDADGDTTTDDHEYARPQFLDTSGNMLLDPFNVTPTIPFLIENPGYYLSLAMGSKAVAMVRRPEGNGWDIHPKSSPTTDAPESISAGLVIRERMVPDTDYWPGTSSVDVVSTSDARYLPYAYGKHWYPTINPFTACDVSDNLMRRWRYDNATTGTVTTNISLSPVHRVASYAGNGRLTMTAACNPGPSHASDGSWSTYNGAGYNGLQRKQYFYRDAWRMVHLGKFSPDTSRNGLQLRYYLDQTTANASNENTYYDQVEGQKRPLPYACGPDSLRIAITSPADGIVQTTTATSGTLAWATAPATPSANYWSARWCGFLKPTTSGQYFFNGSSAGSTNQYIRMWVDGQRVWEVNMSNSATVCNAITLAANKFYPVVVELATSAGGAPGTGPTLRWNLVGSSATAIPLTSIFPPATGGTPAMIPLASFTSLQARIDAPQGISGPAARKIGLMVRPEQTISPLQQGGGAYAMVGWSPTRGIFSQARGVPTSHSLRTLGTYYVGDGAGPNGAADVNGEIIDNSTSVAAVTRIATFKEVARSTVSSTTTYPTQVSYGSPTYTAQPVNYTGDMSKTVAGGKVWTILTPFKIGAYTGSRSVTPQKRQYIRKNQNLTIQLQNDIGGTAPLTLNDRTNGYTLYFFNALTGTGQLGSSSGKVGYSTDGRPWWFSTPAGAADNANRRNLTRTYSTTNNSPWASATSKTQTSTIGTAGTAWRQSGSGAIQISKVGVVSNATAADLATVTGLSITALSTASSPSWPGYSLVAGDYPTDAAAAALGAAAPGDPTLPVFTGAGRSFSIQRSGSSTYFDLNPWITTTGTWSAAAQPQYIPRNTSWPATWVGNTPTTWPLTFAQRPDVWLSTTAPTASASAASIATCALQGATAVTNAGSVTGGNGYEMIDDYSPAGFDTAATSEVWLRIEKSGGNLVFKCYLGSTRPTGPGDPGWYTLPGTLDVSAWTDNLLLGPCLQSGDRNTPVTATFTDLRIETTLASPNNIIDANDWDNVVGNADDLSRYLISQYQAFFGTREITEDFFTWRTATGQRIANEDWFYQPREFWSQRRQWEHTTSGGAAIEKDPFVGPNTTFTSTTHRELLSKTTVLSLDMGVLQEYLRTRTLGDATADVIAGVGGIPVASSATSATLASRFNGVLYAARTNRYPWNPHTNLGLVTVPPSVSGANPYSCDPAHPLPNSIVNPGSRPPAVANGASDDSRRLGDWSDASMFYSGISKLEPYGLTESPAVKPQHFHHGVRILNCRNINWAHPAGASSLGANTAGGIDWDYAAPGQFGLSRMSVVTPNQLYVQGSLNVDRHKVIAAGAATPQMKYTPMAVMGDQITFLSNAWSDFAYQLTGLTVTNTNPGVGGTSTLSCTTLGSAASSTNYHAGIVTHNLPTTRDRVKEGQAAPFVDSMLFLENWNGVSMNYLGSLVVLDSRRYSQSFLLDAPKSYGTTPFGIVGNASWLAKFGKASADWAGQSPTVYSEPVRTYSFNNDFLTSEGTPPFVPFGVSSGGVGSWVKVFK